jgi:hypothetical protein
MPSQTNIMCALDGCCGSCDTELPLQGYNGTVLAYGQTGSGKTHTMSGGVGHYGVKERGVTPRVIDHVFEHVANIKRRLKPGESIHITASAVEIYNEEFRDLSKMRNKDVALNNWDSGKGPKQDLKLQEIPTGQGNRVRAEVAGLFEQECHSVDELMMFFTMCFENRSTGSTKLNETSSRSHALFTINVNRVVVSVGDGVDENLRARVRTEGIESKLHLVDLAGSERVKRSGAEGKQFKEATKINSGLLALGNVIVALAENSPHIPYRSSKLTRLVQVCLHATTAKRLVCVCVSVCLCVCVCVSVWLCGCVMGGKRFHAFSLGCWPLGMCACVLHRPMNGPLIICAAADHCSRVSSLHCT